VTSCVEPFDRLAVAVNCDVAPSDTSAVPPIVTAVTVAGGGGGGFGAVGESLLHAAANAIAGMNAAANLANLLMTFLLEKAEIPTHPGMREGAANYATAAGRVFRPGTCTAAGLW
jgi:hypothetical protein